VDPQSWGKVTGVAITSHLAESDLRAWNAIADLSAHDALPIRLQSERASWFKQRILDEAWELDALSSLASIAERYAAHVAVLSINELPG
jgi:hypothetical protein